MDEPKKPLFDIALFAALLIFLTLHYSGIIPSAYDNVALLIASLSGLLPVLLRAIQSLKEKHISVDLLASIALLAAILAKEWGSAAFINLMLTSARLFDSYTAGRTRNAIRSILKFRPTTVRVKRGNSIEDIPTNAIVINDLIIVKHGERVAIDGVVEDGAGEIDQSSLTGESVPVTKIIGDSVWSGTLLSSGTLTVRAKRIGKDTTLEHTIALIENAQKGKARIKTTADTFATWYITLTLLGSLIVYAVFQDLPLLLSLLLVACADDIAIAIPMGFLASIANAARRGVIIKGGNFLEGLAKVRTIIVDKTGTLTLGKLVVQQVHPFGGMAKYDLLRYAGMTAVYSQHPVSRAIVEHLKLQKIEIEKPERVEELPGKGMRATIKGLTLVSGSQRFVESTGVVLDTATREALHNAEIGGLNITVLALNNRVIGFVASADEVRPEIKNAIPKLKQLGVDRIVMLTGDNEKIASRVAFSVGISEYHANMLPEQKLQFLKDSVGGNKTLAMVGDGVNDAAALSLADIGIAMGTIGSDAAIEAADIALMKDDFSKIPEMIELGRDTMRIVKQNFIIWGAVNIVGLILVSTRMLGPEGAAAYNFLTDFIPITNSMRLFRAR